MNIKVTEEKVNALYQAANEFESKLPYVSYSDWDKLRDALNNIYHDKDEPIHLLLDTVIKPECEHTWVCADNEAVSGGEVCLNCLSIRPAEIKPEGE